MADLIGCIFSKRCDRVHYYSIEWLDRLIEKVHERVNKRLVEIWAKWRQTIINISSDILQEFSLSNLWLLRKPVIPNRYLLTLKDATRGFIQYHRHDYRIVLYDLQYLFYAVLEWIRRFLWVVKSVWMLKQFHCLPDTVNLAYLLFIVEKLKAKLVQLPF